MPVKVRTSGPPIPSARWTVEDMRTFAAAAHAAVSVRTFNEGRGVDDRHFRDYSDRPLKLYARSSTGRALAPKGGAPFPWVRGPKQRSGGYDASRIGQEAGKFYPGGYREYKKSSRLGLVSSENRTGAEVDLVLSGRMARGFRVLRVSRFSAAIGLTGNARDYGPHVDDDRPFLGTSPEVDAELSRTLADIMEGRA